MSVPGPSDFELVSRISEIQRAPLPFLVEMADRFGPVARLMIFRLPVFVLSSPAAVKRVLQENHRNYSKDTIQYNQLARVTGRGLLTADGSFWMRQRRLSQPAFARSRLEKLDEMVTPALERLIGRWETAADQGEPVDVDAEMMRFALEVVGRALFSLDLSAEAERLTEAVLVVLDGIMESARSLSVLPEWWPSAGRRRFRAALRALDEAVYGMIDARQQSGEAGDDLLGMLLRARDEETGAPMTREQARDEVMTMLVAGHETVASALTWTWLLLAQNPAARDQLRAETKQVLGEKLPTTADLEQLPYSGLVFSEALRLYPPAWVISRKALGADEIEGVSIPAGALVILSPYVIQRMPEYWRDPEQFNPERFSGERSSAYFPFGGGPRLCIGSQFAQIEARLALSGLVPRFKLELADEDPVNVDSLVTLRPRGGLWMKVARYEN